MNSNGPRTTNKKILTWVFFTWIKQTMPKEARTNTRTQVKKWTSRRLNQREEGIVYGNQPTNNNQYGKKNLKKNTELHKMRMKHKNARMNAFKKNIMQRCRNILDPEAQTKICSTGMLLINFTKEKKKYRNNEEV